MKTSLFILPVVVLAAATPAAAETITIDVTGIAFSKPKMVAHVGDTVVWDNKDFVAHTATARTHEWDVELPAHKSGQTVLKKAGRIKYYCKYHPNMTGEIEVK